MNTIDSLAAQLEAAKINEEKAKEVRVAAEEALLREVEAKPEGAVTVRGSQYKATVTFGVNRSIDAAALVAIKDSIPPALFEQAVTYKPALVLPGLRYLKNNEPDTYAVLAQAITAKPSKPNVKVEATGAMAEAA